MNHYALAKGKTPFSQQGKNTYRARFLTLNGLFSHVEDFKADDIKQAQSQAKNTCTAYGCRVTSIAQIN